MIPAVYFGSIHNGGQSSVQALCLLLIVLVQDRHSPFLAAQLRVRSTGLEVSRRSRGVRGNPGTRLTGAGTKGSPRAFSAECQNPEQGPVAAGGLQGQRGSANSVRESAKEKRGLAAVRAGQIPGRSQGTRCAWAKVKSPRRATKGTWTKAAQRSAMSDWHGLRSTCQCTRPGGQQSLWQGQRST